MEDKGFNIIFIKKPKLCESIFYTAAHRIDISFVYFHWVGYCQGFHS